MEKENTMTCDCEDGVCESGVCAEGECVDGCCGYEECGCAHHGLMGWLVMAFGATFLLGAFNVLDADMVNIIWPIIIVLAGLKMLFARMCKCC